MYSTDLTESHWQFIKSSLDLSNRKRKHDLREIWNSIHFLLKTGCQWRMLPSDFPKWQLVYYYYSKVNFPTYNNGTTPTYVNLNLLQVPNSVCDSLDVGGNELKIKNTELKIMPNPSDGNFSLQFKAQNKSGTVYIYNVDGALVYSEYVSPFYNH